MLRRTEREPRNQKKNSTGRATEASMAPSSLQPASVVRQLDHRIELEALSRRSRRASSARITPAFMPKSSTRSAKWGSTSSLIGCPDLEREPAAAPGRVLRLDLAALTGIFLILKPLNPLEIQQSKKRPARSLAPAFSSQTRKGVLITGSPCA
jgi:hypothetical protein